MEQCSNLLITTVQIRETDAEVEKVMFQNFQNTTLYVFNGFAHCTQKECPTYVNTPKSFCSSHPSISIHCNICGDLKESIFMWIAVKVGPIQAKNTKSATVIVSVAPFYICYERGYLQLPSHGTCSKNRSRRTFKTTNEELCLVFENLQHILIVCLLKWLHQQVACLCQSAKEDKCLWR